MNSSAHVERKTVLIMMATLCACASNGQTQAIANPPDPPSQSAAEIDNTNGCRQQDSSWQTSELYDSKAFGKYLINNNNWGNLPNQKLWVKGPTCWGVTTSATTERGSIGSYPSITRGWTQNQGAMERYSSFGNNWTTKSGMGIAVTKLTKAQARWSFSAPVTKTKELVDPPRWMALFDVYFHKSANPSPTEWPPFVDLMINQSLADQSIGNSTYYTLVAGSSNATIVTLGGVKYLTYIDQSGEDAFHQPGGHNIHLFQLPTHFTSASGPIWGAQTGLTDVAAIIAFFRQASPRDDAGRPLKNAKGAVITAPLISDDLYLSAINAGWEIDVGTRFTTTDFCVSVQSEPDCK